MPDALPIEEIRVNKETVAVMIGGVRVDPIGDITVKIDDEDNIVWQYDWTESERAVSIREKRTGEATMEVITTASAAKSLLSWAKNKVPVPFTISVNNPKATGYKKISSPQAYVMLNQDFKLDSEKPRLKLGLKAALLTVEG